VVASSPEATSQQVRDLQERAARALPARDLRFLDGWWLRHAPGSAWWAGSVLPHRDAGPSQLLPRVIGAEEFYARHGATTRFQLSPGVCPDGLDAVLADRGYRRHSPMSLQATSVSDVAGRVSPPPLRVRIDDRPTAGWLDVWSSVHGHGVEPGWELEMLDRVRLPSAYASALIADDVVAVGRAVADGGWAGVFGMATRPEARGGGAARAVLASLAEWTGHHGADHMYLQVERDNVPALRLYSQAGFREVCCYHYRSARLA
jgi:GNAT superfamily N-acetyltransferase